MAIYVHERIIIKHKNISKSDVIHAWNNCSHYRVRTDKDKEEYIALGMDNKGRQLQMIAVIFDDNILIYHAMTPPTKKALKELGYIQ